MAILLGMGSLILALVALNVMAVQGQFETGDEGPAAVAPATTEEEPASRPDASVRSGAGVEPTEPWVTRPHRF